MKSVHVPITYIFEYKNVEYPNIFPAMFSEGFWAYQYLNNSRLWDTATPPVAPC